MASSKLGTSDTLSQALPLYSHCLVPPHPKHLPLLSLAQQPSIRILQMVPLLSRHIQRQQLVLPLPLIRSLRDMNLHRSLRRRALDIEVQVRMLNARPVRLMSARYRPVPRPPTPARLAISLDLALAVHALPGQQLPALGVCPHAVGGAVEDGGFAVGGEYFEVQDVGYCACESRAEEHEPKVETLLRGAGRLFPERELLPGYSAGVVGYRDSAAAGCRYIVGQGGASRKTEVVWFVDGGDRWSEAGAEEEDWACWLE